MENVAKIQAMLMEPGKKGPRNVQLEEATKALKRPSAVIWVDVEEPEKGAMAKVAQAFKLHHLAVEDALNERQRTKIEEYGNFAFVVLKAFRKECYESSQLCIFLGQNFIVSTHGKGIKAVEQVAHDLKANPSLMARGADYVAYMIMDGVVDDIFPHLDELEEETDKAEDMMLTTQPDKVQGILKDITELKRRNLCIRKLAWPMRDVLTLLARRDYKFVKPEHEPYFRDVYDHMLRIVDITEMNRELLAATMESYLAIISNNLNMAMKKMTALAAMFAAPMLIASVYGMNFQAMPELTYPYGEYIALGEMLVVVVLMFIGFKIIKWL